MIGNALTVTLIVVVVYSVWKFWRGDKLVREIERLIDENERLRRLDKNERSQR